MESQPHRAFSFLGLVLYLFCLGCGNDGEDYLDSPVIDQPVKGRHLAYSPDDGAVVQVNPPGFVWTYREGSLSYRFLLFSSGDLSAPIVESEPLVSTVMALDRVLVPGEYCWIVQFRDALGDCFGRSPIMHFAVSEGIPELPRPETGNLVRDIGGKRPRLFLFSEYLGEIRRSIEEGNKEVWVECRQLADNALEEPFYPEPAPYRTSDFDVAEWRRTFRPGKLGSAHLVRLALAYHLTGKGEYLEAAKGWLLHLASWDSDGITSYNLPLPDGSTGNDEAAMPMLQRMALGFDWLDQYLEPQERSLVLSSLRSRGNQVLNHYREVDFKSNPWSSHDGQVLAYLGLASLACLGEFQDAEQWLDYALSCYLTSFPCWGGEDGGWAQGLSYWNSDLLAHSVFLDALRMMIGFDLYKKPFFRNNGYFPIFFDPPGTPSAAFGDIFVQKSVLNRALLMRKFSRATGDPAFQWYGQTFRNTQMQASDRMSDELDWREWGIHDVLAVLTPLEPTTNRIVPSGLPASRLFERIGWVAMHSNLLEPETNVSVFFKSSRFGSISHSHADQNSLQVNAFGERLLIDSGYYPWYGSDHHILWSKQTWAHNAILVNGRGQGDFFMGASGNIEYFEASRNLTMVRGECSNAYNVAVSPGTLESWGSNLSQPLPSQQPEVRIARRALAFTSREQDPWLAVHDYLETDGPATFEYLFHAFEKMQLEEDAGIIRVRRNASCLEIHVMTDSELAFSQTDEFSVPPADRYQMAERQWHLRMMTKKPSARVRFLALLIPHKKGEATPTTTSLDLGDVKGFRVGDEEVLAWWGQEETGSYEDHGKGRLFLKLGKNGALRVCP